MELCAEGAETAGQVHRLRSLGCTTVQGNYFSEPVPAEELPEVIGRLSIVGVAS